MPIIRRDIGVGTKIRWVRDEEHCKTPDVDSERIYVIAGHTQGEGWYFYDDAGEKNYAANEDGTGLFEIVG